MKIWLLRPLEQCKYERNMEDECRVPFYLFLLISVRFWSNTLCCSSQATPVYVQQVMYLIKYYAFSFQTDPLEKLVTAYCEFRKLPRSRLKFLFDGDELKGGETPEQLDMENEDVIDVRVKQFARTSTSVRTNSARRMKLVTNWDVLNIWRQFPVGFDHFSSGISDVRFVFSTILSLPHLNSFW